MTMVDNLSVKLQWNINENWYRMQHKMLVDSFIPLYKIT